MFSPWNILHKTTTDIPENDDDFDHATDNDQINSEMIVKYTSMHEFTLTRMAIGSTQSGPVSFLDPSIFVTRDISQVITAFVSPTNSSSSLFGSNTNNFFLKTPCLDSTVPIPPAQPSTFSLPSLLDKTLSLITF